MASEVLPQFVTNHSTELILAAELAVTAGYMAVKARSFQSTSEVYKFNTFEPAWADQLMAFADRTIDYVREENVGAVALMDVAARPFCMPFMAAWNRRYSHDTDPRPPIFFINPQGFQARGARSILPAVGTATKALIKGYRPQSPHHLRTKKVIAEGLPRELPGLYDVREQPVLVMDACLHTGNSAHRVLAGLRDSGFEDVRLGVGYQQTRRWQRTKIQPDLVLSDEMPFGGCYPFGIDRTRDKTYTSSVSTPTTSRRRIAAGRHLRRGMHTALQASIEAQQEFDRIVAEEKRLDEC